MNHLMLEILRCPLHPREKTLDLSDDKFICRTCSTQFPIIEGIADFLLIDSANQFFLETEAKQWDEHAEKYMEDRQNDIVSINCVGATVRLFKPRENDVVLDVGCGAGLVVQEYYRDSFTLVAYDLSLQSLFVLKKRFGDKILCVRGDMARMPFVESAFTKVICANTIQHVPSHPERRECIAELERVLKPQGEVVITTHTFSPTKKRWGDLKEGEARSPSGNVQYIYRFEKDEFKTLLNVFSKVRIFGASFPHFYRFKRTFVSMVIEGILQRLQFISHHGHMFIAIAKKQ